MKTALRAIAAALLGLACLAAPLVGWHLAMLYVYPSVFPVAPVGVKLAVAMTDNGPFGQASRAFMCAVDADECPFPEDE